MEAAKDTEMIKGNYINGGWYTEVGLSYIEICNPARKTEVVGRVLMADKNVAKKALEASKNAFWEWKKVPLGERIRLVEDLLGKLAKNENKMASIITSENGKMLQEARNEVNAAIDESRFHLRYLASHQIEAMGKTELRYEPLGTILAITPWNFPLATIMRKLVPAVVSGNSVIVKSSEYAPLTAIALFDLIDDTAFPKGVLNLINGRGNVIGRTLVGSQVVKAISFTGSCPTGNVILKEIAGRDVRFQAEMGGSNVVVVLNDADLNEVIPALIVSGFSCCGQWCTGTSRIIAENGIHDRLVERLRFEMANIKYGDGMDPQVTMGPLANKMQFDAISEKIETGLREGAILEYGGHAEASETELGYFMRPTLFSGARKHMSLAKEEVFGPVLTVFKAADLDEAIALANANPFGLSASIYTHDDEKARAFAERMEAGLVHINLHTAFRQYEMPLRGWKSSGFGLPECGRFMLDLCTNPKVIYSK